MSSEAHATHGTADFWRANHCINSECVYDSGHGGLCSHLEVAGPRKRQAVHRYDDAESRPERGARKAPRSRDGRRGKPVELCALGKAEEARCGEVASPPARSEAVTTVPMEVDVASVASGRPPREENVHSQGGGGVPHVRVTLPVGADLRISAVLTVESVVVRHEPPAAGAFTVEGAHAAEERSGNVARTSGEPPSAGRSEASVVVVPTPVDELSAMANCTRDELERDLLRSEACLKAKRSLHAKTKREDANMFAVDVGYRATYGADCQNTDRLGCAFSFGAEKSADVRPESFARGRQVVAAKGQRPSGICSPHPVPRPCKANGDADAVAILRGPVMTAAAKITTELLRKHKPAKYARMEKYARHHRYWEEGTVWTSARISFMRNGSSVPTHPDAENMPGTDGADLLLTLGEVSGGDLVLHVDGECIPVGANRTVLADFLNDHEVTQVSGTGLRVAFIFWQQRMVVLSDHVIHQLGAVVFTKEEKELWKRDPSLLAGAEKPLAGAKKPLCHFFWHTLGAPTDAPQQMRALNRLSLRSAAVDHRVVLWSYQTYDNLPEHVTVRDANEVLPFAVFQRALREGGTRFLKDTTPGRHIAHLSDLIRVRVLRRHAGWWLDLDTIVLKPLPTSQPYCFATIPQKRAGGGGSCHVDGQAMALFEKQAHENGRLWRGHNPSAPDWDGQDAFQNTPIFIERKEDPLVIEWERRVEDLVLSPRTIKWLSVVHAMADAIVDHKLQRYVQPPIAFCPYPFWMKEVPLAPPMKEAEVKFGTEIPSLTRIRSESYTLQTFFMSSSSEATSGRTDAWFEAALRPDCALRALLRDVLDSA